MRLVFLSCGSCALNCSTDCLQFSRMENGENVIGSAGVYCPDATDGVRRVTVNELRDLMARNEAFVIDVRNQASYDAGHIRGSKLIRKPK